MRLLFSSLIISLFFSSVIAARARIANADGYRCGTIFFSRGRANRAVQHADFLMRQERNVNSFPKPYVIGKIFPTGSYIFPLLESGKLYIEGSPGRFRVGFKPNPPLKLGESPKSIKALGVMANFAGEYRQCTDLTQERTSKNTRVEPGDGDPGPSERRTRNRKNGGRNTRMRGESSRAGGVNT